MRELGDADDAADDAAGEYINVVEARRWRECSRERKVCCKVFGACGGLQPSETQIDTYDSPNPLHLSLPPMPLLWFFGRLRFFD